MQAYCEAIASAVTLTLAAAEDISPQLGGATDFAKPAGVS